MIVASTDGPTGATHDAAAMLARAVQRSDARVDAAIAELGLDEALRLDEQERALVLAMLEQAVGDTAAAIASGAARRLGRPAADARAAVARLPDSGLLHDRALVGAVIEEARLALIDDALVANRAPDETPMLLARLSDHLDPVVRDRAAAYLLAESRRARAPVRSPELPQDVAHRLGWTVAALLAHGAPIEATRALCDAAQDHLATIDTDTRTRTSARLLASALATDTDDLAALLLEALAEGRLMLFAGLVAEAAGLDMAEATAASLDAEPDVLLTILRAVGVERDGLARIGLRLADADRARDAEALADVVDAVAAIAPDQAAALVAPLALDAGFRAAVRRLDRAAR